MATEEPTTPPDPGDQLPPEPPSTRWPRAIGIISLIYALGGLACGSMYLAWLSFADMLPEMWRGGVTVPIGLRLAWGALLVVNLCLGILLIAGAIGTMRRKRSGPRRLLRWVVLRMLLILLNAIVIVLTGPAQVEIARQAIRFQERMAEENDVEMDIPERTDDEHWRTIMIQLGVSSAVVAIYPVALGLWLSRRRIREEVELWT